MFILIQHLIIWQIWLDDILLENDEHYFVSIYHQLQTMFPENKNCKTQFETKKKKWRNVSIDFYIDAPPPLLLIAKVNRGITPEGKSGQVSNRIWPFFYDP